MIFKRFRVNIVIRVIGLALALFIFEFVWEHDDWADDKNIFFGGSLWTRD